MFARHVLNRSVHGQTRNQNWFGLLLMLCVLAVAKPVLASEPDYLASGTDFERAWTELREAAGEAAVFRIEITPNRIELQAQSPAGGARVDAWTVTPKEGWFGKWSNEVRGPFPVRSSGSVGDVSQGLFAQGDIRLDRLQDTLSAALAEVPLMDPGRATSVRIERRLNLIPTPSFGEVRWSIGIANARERATVETLADGTVLGADVSGTMRGRNKDFRSQSDWNFARVQQGFENIVEARDVFEVRVRRSSISVTATAHDQPDQVRNYSWDGGRFTGGLAAMTNTKAIVPNADLPFQMPDVDIARLPDVIAAARAAAPAGWGHVYQVIATKPPSITEEPKARWVVELVPTEANNRERVEAVVGVDAQLISMKLPKSLRAPTSYLSPEGALAALADIKEALGADLMVVELMFRTDRVEVSVLKADDPSQVEDITYAEGEFRKGFMSMPAVMSGKPFPLSDIASLSPEDIARMQAHALEALKIPESKVDRFKIWDGAPFWQSNSGIPFVDVRIDRPGSIGSGGYVVFLLNGQFVDAFK